MAETLWQANLGNEASTQTADGAKDDNNPQQVTEVNAEPLRMV